MKLKSLVLTGLVALSAWCAMGQNCTLTAGVSPLNEFASAGEDVTFTANITGGVGPFNMYWADGRGRALSPLNGANTSVTLDNVTPGDAGLIFLVVYDLGTGCGTVTAGKLFVVNAGGRLFPKELSWMTE